MACGCGCSGGGGGAGAGAAAVSSSGALLERTANPVVIRNVIPGVDPSLQYVFEKPLAFRIPPAVQPQPQDPFALLLFGQVVVWIVGTALLVGGVLYVFRKARGR